MGRPGMNAPGARSEFDKSYPAWLILDFAVDSSGLKGLSMPYCPSTKLAIINLFYLNYVRLQLSIS